MNRKLAAEEKKQRNIRWIRALFLVYLLIVIKLIIFKYPMEQLRAIAATWRRDVILEGLDTANFTPFKTIRMYIDYVLGIEVFQLFSAFGAFDVDDIILNCMGAVWGYLFYLIVEAIRRKRIRERKQKDKNKNKKTGTGQGK